MSRLDDFWATKADVIRIRADIAFLLGSLATVTGLRPTVSDSMLKRSQEIADELKAFVSENT